MRIGTYNVNWAFSPTSRRRQPVVDWLNSQAVDLWLLTEVHDKAVRKGMVVSPPRANGSAPQRWCGILTAHPQDELRTTGNSKHAGEEGLRLARLRPTGASRSLLVACSVLPWKGAGR